MNKLKLSILTLLWGALIFIGGVYTQRNIPYAYPHNDFYIYWIASKLWFQGHSPYGLTPEFLQLKSSYQLDFHQATGYSYPPLLAVLFYPFTLIPPKLAALVFFIFNVILYGLFINKATKKHPHPIWITLYLFTFFPAIGSLYAGQINFVWLWLMVVVINSNKTKSVIASIIASSLKVYPGFLSIFTLISHPKPKLIKPAVIATLILLVINLSDGGKAIYYYLTKVLFVLQLDKDTYFTQQSINAFIYRLNPQSEYLIYGAIFSLIMFFIIAIRRQSRHVKLMMLLTVLTLIAGRNTYWNFLPTVISQLYLFKHSQYKKLLMVTILLTNCLYLFSYPLNQIAPPTHPILNFCYSIILSTGTLYGLIQLWLLAK